jgi:membrane-bound inhibitor of C-type lysozyme
MLIRAEYRCDDDSRYNANFDNDANTVELATGRRRLAVLDQRRSGSGIAYEGGGYTLRGQGTEAYITFPTGNRKRCTTDP